jgi:hypothetical protein
MDATPTKIRAEVAAAVRHHPEDVDTIARKRAELKEALLAKRIREVVDSAPPLDDSQRLRLVAILTGSAA